VVPVKRSLPTLRIQPAVSAWLPDPEFGPALGSFLA
jgi:hypothetical protein